MLKYPMLKNITATISIFIIIILSPFISNYFLQEGYVKINREVKSTLFNKYDEKNLLLFFGYVGCSDVCAPRLDELSSIYKNLKRSGIPSKVIFINISELKDHKLPDLFAKSYHKEFDGIYLEKEQLQSLKKEFDVYSAHALGDPEKINHTAFLYLLKRVDSKYFLNKIYTKKPFSVEIIDGDI